MLKALEILKEKREICVRIFEGDDYSDGLDYYENKIIKLDEAIAELEALNNRSCENCKHYKQSLTQIYKTCYVNKVNGFNLESDIDFCCNKWESK